MANIQIHIRESGGVLVPDLATTPISAGDTITFSAPAGTGVKLYASPATAAALDLGAAEIPANSSITITVNRPVSGNLEISLEFPEKPAPAMLSAGATLQIRSSSASEPAPAPAVKAAFAPTKSVSPDAGKLLSFNGVDGDTGGYFYPPLTQGTLANWALGVQTDRKTDAHLDDLLKRRKKDQAEKKDHLGVKEGVDPKKIEECGWGVVFTKDTPADVKQALRTLLDFRKGQATQIKAQRYQEYFYRPQETKVDFLERIGMGSGPVDPDKAPYYMLLVGSPEQIPYSFQYQLDVQFAVGRIHFDTAQEYADYAQSVIDAETGTTRLSKRAAFFATENPDDESTIASLNDLAIPLSEIVAKDQKDRWTVETFIAEEATKKRLTSLLGGDATPAFLFTASHGMVRKLGHAKQREETGALVCQEWPGPKVILPVSEDAYFAAGDLTADAKLHGTIAMFFACYGAGMPTTNEFALQDGVAAGTAIAEKAFVSRLPQRMLGRKNGALAVIGHIERAWGHSFVNNRGDQQLQCFESTLKRLLEGHPVGSATEYLNSRYAEISSDLTIELEKINGANKQPKPEILSYLWTSNNDARNYGVIGDPAVRIMV